MNTSYLELCNLFFNKIKDYSFVELGEETSTEIVMGYIPNACLHFESCTQDLDDRDEELKEFNYEMSNTNKMILVNYMLIEYLTVNFVTPASSLKSRMSSQDFKSLQLPQQLAKALEVRNTLLSENEHLAINKSFNPAHSKLFNIVTGKTTQE